VSFRYGILNRVLSRSEFEAMKARKKAAGSCPRYRARYRQTTRDSAKNRRITRLVISDGRDVKRPRRAGTGTKADGLAEREGEEGL